MDGFVSDRVQVRFEFKSNRPRQNRTHMVVVNTVLYKFTVQYAWSHSSLIDIGPKCRIYYLE
jgi:hypothetical protein